MPSAPYACVAHNSRWTNLMKQQTSAVSCTLTTPPDTWVLSPVLFSCYPRRHQEKDKAFRGIGLDSQNHIKLDMNIVLSWDMNPNS